MIFLFNSLKSRIVNSISTYVPYCCVLWNSYLGLLEQELAESHCLNSETLQPTTVGGEARQQEASILSFAAIDMVAKLVVLLVKVLAPQTFDLMPYLFVDCVAVLLVSTLGPNELILS